MATAPSPAEIFVRAEEEGRRRLSMSLLQQVTTGFIAGVTIVFGIAALGVVETLAKPTLGDGLGRLAGALAFAIGLVFLVVGRTELFTENFFGPFAATIDEDPPRPWGGLLRLWGAILMLNLVGGAILIGVLTVEGALPVGTSDTLVGLAEEIVGRAWTATGARAVLAGALITLLSYLLHAAETVTARILVTYMTGFLLALGPFDHVVVSALHVLFAVWLGGAASYGDVAFNVAVSTVGNLAGGMLLITLTHIAQVKGEAKA